METREVLEHVERAEVAAERQENAGRNAAVVVSVMAAMLAIASLAGSRSSTEAIECMALLFPDADLYLDWHGIAIAVRNAGAVISSVQFGDLQRG